MTSFFVLLLAIASELVATTALKLTDGFTRAWPVVFVVAGYGAAFYLLSLTLRTIPLSVTYAIWSGLGTAATAAIGAWLFREPMSLTRVAGIMLVIGGVVLLNLSRGAPSPGVPAPGSWADRAGTRGAASMPAREAAQDEAAPGSRRPLAMRKRRDECA